MLKFLCHLTPLEKLPDIGSRASLYGPQLRSPNMSKHHHLKNTKNIFSAGFDTLWKCIRFSYQTNNYLQQGMSSEAYWVVVSLMDFSNKLTITERQWFNNIHHELCNVYPFVNIFPVLGCWIEKRALFWAIKQLDLEFCVKKIKNPQILCTEFNFVSNIFGFGQI